MKTITHSEYAEKIAAHYGPFMTGQNASAEDKTEYAKLMQAVREGDGEFIHKFMNDGNSDMCKRNMRVQLTTGIFVHVGMNDVRPAACWRPAPGAPFRTICFIKRVVRNRQSLAVALAHLQRASIRQALTGQDVNTWKISAHDSNVLEISAYYVETGAPEKFVFGVSLKVDRKKLIRFLSVLF